MEKILISDEAYNEFKAFLEENNINNFSIRINLAGYGCSGPAFNISVEDPTEEDDVVKVKDMTFIFEKKLTEEFGGFQFLSTEENNGRGLSVKPIIAPETSGCGSCGGGCH
ncbi:HesB-like protein [Clostridium sp.]|uniref:HesB-like protein n=1 Tax=Clostridium sp. TaxID=1506 RepID=UPI003993C008